MKIIEIKIVQSSVFKTLIEVLKEIIVAVNFEFIPSQKIKDKNNVVQVINGGIKMLAMNAQKTVLVCLKLNANEFPFFNCQKYHKIGVNLQQLFKLLKIMTGGETLILEIDDDDINNLLIRIENADKKKVTINKLKLMDIKKETININTVQFDSFMTIPSNDFHKICRDMSNIADEIEIINIANEIRFKCNGTFASQETILTESDDIKISNTNKLIILKDHDTHQKVNSTQNNDEQDDEQDENQAEEQDENQDEEQDENQDEEQENVEIIKQSSQQIAQGKFDLKNLTSFAKCSGFGGNVELYLKNDYPIFIKYYVANMGCVYLCLSPCEDKNRDIDSKDELEDIGEYNFDDFN